MIYLSVIVNNNHHRHDRKYSTRLQKGILSDVNFRRAQDALAEPGSGEDFRIIYLILALLYR
jgi:hypothetical protein